MTKKRALVAVPSLVLAGLLAVAALGVVRGSSPSDPTGGSAGSSADSAAPDSAPGSGPGSGVDGESTDEPGTDTASGTATGGARQAAATAPMSRAVISTGQVTLHATSVARARAETLRLVTSWQGSVSEEQASSDDHGRITETTMTLRVPSAKFDAAMRALAGLGEVEQESRSAEDVTTRVLDTDARVRAAERSIQQIEKLLSRAGDLGDIITIESDLARRQADLDSLKSQQAWLEDQTSLSTINLYLSRPMSGLAPEHEARGFLAGLEDGWRALTGATVLLLTAAGALLPFAVLLALLGVPVWLVVRRRRGLVGA